MFIVICKIHDERIECISNCLSFLSKRDSYFLYEKCVTFTMGITKYIKINTHTHTHIYINIHNIIWYIYE